MLGTFLGHGRRMHRSSSAKIKCIELLPPYVAPLGDWSALWGKAWSQSVLAAQIAQVRKLGANTLKVTGSLNNSADGSDPNGYPAPAIYRARRQWFFAQCRMQGLGVYWTLGNGLIPVVGNGGDTVQMDLMIAMAATIAVDAAEILVGFDIVNEIETGGPANYFPTGAQCKQDMTRYVAGLRVSCPGVPLGLSTAIGAPASLGNGNGIVDLQYDLGLDFHDVHLYYANNSPIPSSADLANLESRTKYLGRHFIGEMGCNDTSIQAAWFNGIGDIARRPHSHGAVLFGLTDFDTNPYGIYTPTDTAFASPRPQLGAFQRWAG